MSARRRCAVTAGEDAAGEEEHGCRALRQMPCPCGMTFGPGANQCADWRTFSRFSDGQCTQCGKAEGDHHGSSKYCYRDWANDWFGLDWKYRFCCKCTNNNGKMMQAGLMISACVACKNSQQAAPAPQPFSQAAAPAYGGGQPAASPGLGQAPAQGGFGGGGFGQTAFGGSTFGAQPAAPAQQERTLYHGTSLEAALNIQKVGFDVARSGSNAGAALGSGLYVTSTLEKAMNYAKRMPCQGAIFELQVQLGKCFRVSSNDSNMAKWQEMGHDSAWAAAGIIGEREENCIKDPRPPRVVIQHIILGHT